MSRMHTGFGICFALLGIVHEAANGKVIRLYVAGL